MLLHSKNRALLWLETLEDRLLLHGSLTIIEPPPGAISAGALGISGHNVTGYAGYPGDTSGWQHGYFYDGSQYSIFDPPLGYSDLRIQGVEQDTVFGSLTGRHNSNERRTHGFLWQRDSGFRLVDYPYEPNQYLETEILGMDGTTSFGWWSVDGFETRQFFIYDGSAFTSFDPLQPFPGGAWSFPRHCISGNTIVWSYNESGFLYDGSRVTTLDYPGADVTFLAGINGTSVVGVFYQQNDYHGFVYDGTAFRLFDPPDSVFSLVTSVSGSSVIGDYWDAQGLRHAYFYDGSRFSTVEIPGITEPTLLDVSGRTVLGYGTDAAGREQSFVYQPDIVVKAVKTSDSRQLLVNYVVNSDNLADTTTSFQIGISRSATPGFDPQQTITTLMISQGTLDANGVDEYAVGQHQVKVELANGLPPMPASPYVVAKADPQGQFPDLTIDDTKAHFRTYVIGAVTHGLDPLSFLPSELPLPSDWVNRMASALKAAGYDETIGFQWQNAFANPQFPISSPYFIVGKVGNTQHNADDLAAQIMAKAANLVSSAGFEENDVIDVHFIGHSLGGELVALAAAKMLALASTNPNLQHGYYKMTLLDPHPASNDLEVNASFTPGSFSLPAISSEYLINAYRNFQNQTKDNPVITIPDRINETEEIFQKTPFFSLPATINPIYKFNLHGIDPAAIRSAKNIKIVDLTDRFFDGKVVTHTNIHDYYQKMIVSGEFLDIEGQPYHPLLTPAVTLSLDSFGSTIAGTVHVQGSGPINGSAIIFLDYRTQREKALANVLVVNGVGQFTVKLPTYLSTVSHKITAVFTGNGIFGEAASSATSIDPQAGAFAAPQGPVPYQIEVVNDPVHRIDVTNALDPNFAWSTFQLSSMGFGGASVFVPAGNKDYDATVELVNAGLAIQIRMAAHFDPGTGVLTMSFQGWDPATDSQTLLPVEDGTGIGTGFVEYTIAPKADLGSGMQIRNIALVQFDDGFSYTTNQVDPHDPSQGTDPHKEGLITVEATRPSSHVNALPASQDSADVPLSWSGNDGAGSGIASYDIYMSDNGGTFNVWLQGSTATSATFTGTYGHTYRFYSAATDNVGNKETAAGTAQATVSILGFQNKVAFSVGIVRVWGTDAADAIALAPTADGQRLEVTLNGKVISSNLSVSGIKQIRVFGRNGNDKITVNNLPKAFYVEAGSGTDKLIVNGKSTANAFVLGASSLTVNGRAIGVNGLESLAMNGKGASDVLTVQAMPTFAVTFAGGTGSDKIQGPNTASTWLLTSPNGGKLNGSLQFGGVEKLMGGTAADTLIGLNQNNSWNITGTNSGKVNALTFAGMENLTGGSKNDIIILANGKGVSGRIDGGGGRNSLNYAAYTIAVAVDLKAGTASSIGGGIANIRDVSGGSANDLLKGDALDNFLSGNGGNDVIDGRGGNNILMGGAGNDTLTGGNLRDLIFGGIGSDTLSGGAGEDILFSGTTTFDANRGAINALFTYWIRPDLDYKTRVARLRAGATKVPGVPKLDSTTVLQDTSTDTLLGGTELDWYFAKLAAPSKDAVAPLETGETRN